MDYDSLANYGQFSTQEVRIRRLYNEEPSNNGLILESMRSSLNLKTDVNLITSVTGNITIGSTGYFVNNINSYYDIVTGTSACFNAGSEICLEAGTLLDLTGADMAVTVSNGLTETIGGNKNVNVTGFVSITSGTSTCIEASTDLCLNPTGTLDIDGANMSVDLTNNLTQTIGGTFTTTTTGHIGITSGTTLSLGADEIILTTNIFTLNGVTSLSLCDGIIELSDGTASAPSYTFCEDYDTGIYHPAANQLALSTAGTQRVIVDASGNVGIGTDTPSQKLDVSGDVVVQGGDLYLVDTNEKIASDGTDMFFHVNGAEVVRFESGGNVGIGTNNPTQTLDVNGDALIQGGDLYLVDTNEKIASDGTDMFFHVNGAEVVRFEAGGNVGIGTNNPTQTLDVNGDTLVQGGDLYLSNTNYKISSDGTTSLGLYTGGSERITIGSTGLVGIGTTNPTSTLQVYNGSASVTVSSENAFIVESITGVDTLRVDTLLETTYIKNLGISGNVEVCSGIIELSAGTATAPSYTFCTDLDTGMYLSGTNQLSFGTSGTQRVVIASTGNVGIGTNNPTQTLHVQGDGLIQGGDLFLFDTNEKIASNGTDIFFHVNGTEKVRFTSTGFVGIGTDTTSNASRMIQVYNADPALSGIQFYNNTSGFTSVDGLRFGYDSSSNAMFYNYENTDMYFATNSTERFRILSTGNVGIGTNNPGQTLDVNGDTLIRGGDLFLTNTSYKIASNGTTSLSLFTAGTERVTVGSTGNVGIGSTTPTQTLDVNGDALVQGGDLYLTNTSYKVASNGTTSLSLFTAGTERVTVGSTGNVGIGSTTPTQTLDVNGDALVQGGDLYLVDTNEKIASDGTDMFFHVNGAEVVRFEAGGNVGIGTNNPTTKLQVDGNTLLNGTLGVTGNTTVTVDSVSAFVVENTTGTDCFRINTINCTTYLETLGVSGDVTIEGNLTVNGTQTILNTETVNVDDNNIVLNGVSAPTDISAEGGGITLKGDSDYTIMWDSVCAGGSWKHNQNVEVSTGLGYYINCLLALDEEVLVVNTRSNAHAGGIYLSTNNISTPTEGDWRIKTLTNNAGKQIIQFQRYDSGSWTSRLSIN